MSKLEGKSKSSEPCIPSVLEVTSNTDKGKKVSLTGDASFARLLYYESMLDDTVRADVTFGDTGNSIDKNSVMEGLPLVGTEEVKLKFKDNDDNEVSLTLYANKITPVFDDSVKSLVTMSLVSEEYIRNEQGSSRVNIRFDGKISDNVDKIFKDYLKTKKKLDIEDTRNNLNFLGNNRKPLYTLNWLSRASVPSTDGKFGDSAGYLFFETSEGYHFKSIDALMAQEKKKSYIFNQSPDTEAVPAGYSGKILEYTADNRVDVQKKYQMGAYGSRLVVFDPFNCKYQVVKQTAEETKKRKGIHTAGKDLPKLNPIFENEQKNEFTRTTYMLIDTGTIPTGDTEEQIKKSQDENFESRQILNQAIRRYNQLYTGMVTVTIAGDFSLHAGDAIFVDSPGLTPDRDDSINREFGGLYIIADLCHYISPQETYTKLNLVRDSFGRTGNHTLR